MRDHPSDKSKKRRHEEDAQSKKSKLSQENTPSQVKPQDLENGSLIRKDDITSLKNTIELIMTFNESFRNSPISVEAKTSYKILRTENPGKDPNYYAIYNKLLGNKSVDKNLSGKRERSHVTLQLAQDIDTKEWHLLRTYQIHNNSELQANAEREIEVLKKLEQLKSYVVNKQDNENSTIYVVETYAFGKNLSSLKDEEANLDLDKKIDIACKILSELEYLHKNGVLHCDIKLDNMIYNPEEDIVKFIDFDVALTMNSKGQGIANNLRGTLGTGMIAPETICKDGTFLYDEKTETYAIGQALLNWFDLDKDQTHPSTFFASKAKDPREQDILSILTKMTDPDSSKRPALEMVNQQLRQLSANKAAPIQEPPSPS